VNVDFGKTAADYARYRAGFPDEFFDRVIAAGIVRAGDRILDLGTGTGTLGRGFALRGCRSVGLDTAAELLDQAKRLDIDSGTTSTRYVVGCAEDVPFDDGTFDVVTAGQCWHWFDRPRAAAEARRTLKPGGRLVIAHFDWIPLAANVVETTEHLIGRHNPAWKLGGGNGMHPQWLADAAGAGFVEIETFSFDVRVPYSHEAWRGRIRASAGVAASLPAAEVAQFDAELERVLATQFSQEPLMVPHRLWAVTARAHAT